MTSYQEALAKEQYDDHHPRGATNGNNAPVPGPHDSTLDLVAKRRDPEASASKERLVSMQESVKTLLENLGEDPRREV